MQMVYCCDGYPEEERTSFGGITKWLERTVAPSPDFKAKIDKVLKDLWQIATTRNLKSPFAAGAPRLAPVEFIFIGMPIDVPFCYTAHWLARCSSICSTGLRLGDQIAGDK
jgi:hypothetical protein